jgi:transposase
MRGYGLLPVISPNRRNTKEPIVIARKFRWFNSILYRERYKVERTFGWQDTYRKLVISDDRLEETRKGFRLLAYAMVHFRVTFNTS